MRSVVTFAALALVTGMIVPRYAEHVTMQSAREAPAASVPAPVASNSYSVTVPRDGSGHFRVNGRVDGRQLDFMVDTGASVVALTADDAAALGIHPAHSDYTIHLKTANGIVHAAPATLGMVEIGDVTLRDVAAVVMPDGALSDNLLGLSFLSRLRHFEYSQGTMVLEQ